jgi:hypothetical protein
VKNNLVADGNAPSPYTIEKKSMQVYIFGDTAVVTYIKEYRQTPDTTKFFDEDDTDVFKRGPKGWLLQFSKISRAVVTRQAERDGPPGPGDSGNRNIGTGPDTKINVAGFGVNQDLEISE